MKRSVFNATSIKIDISQLYTDFQYETFVLRAKSIADIADRFICIGDYILKLNINKRNISSVKFGKIDKKEDKNFNITFNTKDDVMFKNSKFNEYLETDISSIVKVLKEIHLTVKKYQLFL